MIKPQLWIIAGANGSGKTTLVGKYQKYFFNKIPVINPDTIANVIEPNNTVYHSSKVQIQAGRKAILLQQKYLQSKDSFLIETTFSGHREVNLLQEAKEKGFKTNLVFIFTNDVIKNIERVEDRVEEKGHFVATDDIIRRYDKSFSNLKNNYKKVERLIVVDNSFNKPLLKLSMENNKVKYISKNIPNILKQSIPIIQHYTKDSSLDI